MFRSYLVKIICHCERLMGAWQSHDCANYEIASSQAPRNDNSGFDKITSYSFLGDYHILFFLKLNVIKHIRIQPKTQKINIIRGWGSEKAYFSLIFGD